MIVRYRARAIADIDEIYYYLCGQNRKAAEDVLRAICAGSISSVRGHCLAPKLKDQTFASSC